MKKIKVFYRIIINCEAISLVDNIIINKALPERLVEEVIIKILWDERYDALILENIENIDEEDEDILDKF